MGNGKYHLGNGDFSKYLYEEVDTVEGGGLKAKVLQETNDNGTHHTSPPLFSHSSDIYMTRDPDTKIPSQARVYKNHEPNKDFDWGHDHKEHGVVLFPKGVVHVQTWTKGADGKWNRSKPRLMTQAEIDKYGALLKAADPNVKFTM